MHLSSGLQVFHSHSRCLFRLYDFPLPLLDMVVSFATSDPLQNSELPTSEVLGAAHMSGPYVESRMYVLLQGSVEASHFDFDPCLLVCWRSAMTSCSKSNNNHQDLDLDVPETRKRPSNVAQPWHDTMMIIMMMMMRRRRRRRHSRK